MAEATNPATDIETKAAKVTIALGHFYIDPEKIAALTEDVAKVLARHAGKKMDPEYRAKTDSDERLFFIDLTVKAKVA